VWQTREYLAGNRSWWVGRAALLGAITAAALMALLPSAQQADSKPTRPASLSVRLATGTQAQALKAGRLQVRVVARRAARVKVSAVLRRTVRARGGKRATRSVALARPATVRLRRGKPRTVSLRLTRSGRRLLAGCSARRVTIVARGVRRSRLRAGGSRVLRLDGSRCSGAGTKAARVFPGCAGEAAAGGGDWPFYSGVPDGVREQRAEKLITAGNVRDLGVAWKRGTPDGGVIHSTPVVSNGCVYTGTDLGNVYSVNAETGKVIWSQALGGGSEGSGTFEGAGIVGSPAVVDGLVYVGATTPKASVLSALDQATGQIVWQTVVDQDEGGGLDSSPVPYDGMVFQAFKGDESSNHSNPGFVIVDGSREGGGKILVKTHTIPAEDFKAGYRGGSMINTPAVDLKRKLIFAGTGNPVSPKQHPRTNALLKIDADPASPTFGKILASARGTSDSYPAPNDIESPFCQTELQWPLGRFSCAQLDYNFLASPNLWTSSSGRPMLGALQKSGVYTAVYADTMEQAWQATLGIPCLGCNLSSTAADKNGIYVAVTGGNLYSLNRETGAIQWATPLTGGMRYNGVAVANGILYSLNDAIGTLQAFDVKSGAPLFAHPFTRDNQTPMHDMGNSSGVSVARNTVFATSQWEGTSTLFALKLNARGGGGEEEPPSGEPPPPPGDGGGAPSGEGVIATGPGAASYGYLTPVATVGKGGTVSYTNVDAVRHNVRSTQGLFRSELADAGQTVPVTGAEKLAPGTYEFFCEPHPNMKGQLTVR
jgi:polyvinyl alcohol dehydrogenase (cytochrome)